VDDRATRDDIAELTAEIRSLGRLLAATAQEGHGERQGGHANITVNMPGGWAAILALAVAGVCAYIAADARGDAAELRSEARDLGRKVERREDYLNMLWQRYPELRPESLKPKEDKKP